MRSTECHSTLYIPHLHISWRSTDDMHITLCDTVNSRLSAAISQTVKRMLQLSSVTESAVCVASVQPATDL